MVVVQWELSVLPIWDSPMIYTSQDRPILLIFQKTAQADSP